jgi:hypothetical protein
MTMHAIEDGRGAWIIVEDNVQIAGIFLTEVAALRWIDECEEQVSQRLQQEFPE